MSQVGNHYSTIPHPSTPTLERQQRDAQLATAFFDLESAIADLKRMAALMETAAEATVFQVEGDLAKHVHEKVGCRDYQVHLFTQDQSDSIDYAIRHTYDLIQKLHRQYYAGYGEAA